MIFYKNPTLFIRFNDLFLIPNKISVNNTLIEYKLDKFLTTEGLILPFSKNYNSKTTPLDDYNGKDYRTLKGCKLFDIIRMNGNVDEIFIGDNGLKKSIVPYSLDKIIFHEEYVANLVLSGILMESETVNDFLYLLELRLGVSGKQFIIYNYNDILEYISGKRKCDKIRTTKFKSKFKTIFL